VKIYKPEHVKVYSFCSALPILLVYDSWQLHATPVICWTEQQTTPWRMDIHWCT